MLNKVNYIPNETVITAQNLNEIQDNINAIWDKINNLYSVGSIYLSVNSTSPASLFGGTWEQIKDRFLLCSGDTYSNGATGGSTKHIHKTQGHTLTIEEIPNHIHTDNKTYWITVAPSSSNNWAFVTNDSENATVRNGNLYGWPKATGGSNSHTHGDTTSSSNMPPYLVIYVWKRIE